MGNQYSYWRLTQHSQLGGIGIYRTLYSPFIFNIALEILARTLKQIKKSNIERGEIKPFLFVKYLIIHVKNLMEFKDIKATLNNIWAFQGCRMQNQFAKFNYISIEPQQRLRLIKQWLMIT